MAEDWKTAPAASKVLDLADDPRPAWLWAGHGDGLLWSNAAADLFGAKLKSSGLKRPESPRPVKGQITRILRLGLLNQSTLSRMQFIAGRKPLSATCRCTPLTLGDQTCLLVVGVDPIASDVLDHAHTTGPDQEPEREVETPRRSGLGGLVDKLARDKRLFEPLDETDDAPPPPVEEPMVPGRDFAKIASEGDDEEAEDDSDWSGGHDADADEAAFAADGGTDDAGPRAGLWQLTGRGLSYARAEYREPQDEDEDAPPASQEEPQTPQGLEQSSRYNFDELSRILTERIGQDGEATPPQPLPEPAPERGGALVPLSDEALVLNRLPLGILIFRDQDILFVNRALVDMTGYENASMLRAAGPGTVFPTAEKDTGAGPVTHLLARDGERVPVSARLQTVTWQGRHAVMLSARSVENLQFSESEVKTFAALCAQLEGGAFIEADRSGRVATVLDNGAPSGVSRGDTLSGAIASSARDALLDFLSKPARFAETERPGIRLAGRKKGDTLLLFAEGRAGLVTGYFGIYAPARPEMSRISGSGLPAASLKRISRELRQPLNTISGFSELMTSEAFGPLSNARYAEYARDIQAAGQAIGDLADELDDFVRLAEGASSLSPTDIDLSSLLADCLVRVRSQAGSARVLLRSAISERLPFVRADAATLKQAVLNMLASAIAESRAGSKVVLSAQGEDDGSVTIHVRDAQKAPNALAEQFVVFRDGQARDGTARAPVRSSIGLTLTRSLVSVNACSFSLAPASETGTLMTLTIPSQLVVTPG